MDEKGSHGGARDILCFDGTSAGEDLFVCKAPSLLYIFVINIVVVTDLDPHVSRGTCVLTSLAPVEIWSVQCVGLGNDPSLTEVPSPGHLASP